MSLVWIKWYAAPKARNQGINSKIWSDTLHRYGIQPCFSSLTFQSFWLKGNIEKGFQMLPTALRTRLEYVNSYVTGGVKQREREDANKSHSGYDSVCKIPQLSSYWIHFIALFLDYPAPQSSWAKFKMQQTIKIAKEIYRIQYIRLRLHKSALSSEQNLTLSTIPSHAYLANLVEGISMLG